MVRVDAETRQLGGWHVACGAWRVACGVWCVVFGVWCVVCGAWCLACSVWCVVRVACGAWSWLLTSFVQLIATSYAIAECPTFVRDAGVDVDEFDGPK